MNPIVIKIKEEMSNQGLSEQRLADKAGLTQNKVHRIVSGKAKRLDIEAINSLVAALGLDSGDASVTPITGTSREGLSFSEKTVGTVGEHRETQTIRQRLGNQDYPPQVWAMADFLDLMTKDMTDEERDAFARELFEDTVKKLKDRKK
jgi:DNA-binding Xre family transcriptional regulator